MPFHEVVPDVAIAESLFRIAFDEREAAARKLPVQDKHCKLTRDIEYENGRVLEYSNYDGPEAEHILWLVAEKQGSLLVSKFVGLELISQDQPATAGDLITAIDLMPTVHPMHKRLTDGLWRYITGWGPVAYSGPQD